MPRTWDQKYAFYAASLYRLGMYIDAGLVSAIMFERYIEDALKRERLPKSTQGDFLCDAIRKLSEGNRKSRYNSKLLHELREIRNKEIIHPDKIFRGIMNNDAKNAVKMKLRRITQFVWEKMDSATFLLYREIDKIPLLEADYAVMEIKELLQNDINNVGDSICDTFLLNDFENLFSMRSKLLYFAKYSRDRLLNKFNGNLDFDIISRVDTTSAYVWLAINIQQKSEDGLRDRITGASASILATPLDLRVYMDFGGKTVAARRDYYQFLNSEEYRKFIEVYRDESLKMFDIDWYCFVINSPPPNAVDVKGLELETQLAEAGKMLKKYEEKNQIITWNRNLIGFILPRSKELQFSEVNDKLETIVKLYYYFTQFRLGRDKKNEKKVEPPWLPKEKDYLLHKTNKVLKSYKLI